MHYFPSARCALLSALITYSLMVSSVGWAAPSMTIGKGGVVTPAELESLLKSGPHALIRAFLVEPSYADKAFIGFRVVQRTPHPVLSDHAPVKVGDVVVSANGIRLETPGQFMAAWGKLKSTQAFSVVVIRDQKKLTLNWYLKGAKAR